MKRTVIFACAVIITVAALVVTFFPKEQPFRIIREKHLLPEGRYAWLTLENNYGSLSWFEGVDASDSMLYENVKIEKNRIEVNAKTLDKPAVIVMNVGYAFRPVIYRDGIICSSCNILAYRDRTIIEVTGFSSYTSSANSNLSIWDDTDSQTVLTGQQARFYANYTNMTSGAVLDNTSANCTIEINVSDGWTVANMTFNETSQLWGYNMTFSNIGAYSWNVTCNGSLSGYETLEINDTSIISDTISPTINIQLPLNGTNRTAQGISFTIADNVAVDKCWYTANSGQNTSLANCANISSIAGEAQGFNRLRVYGNDTSNNIAFSEINYTLDTQGPVINSLTEKPSDPAEYLAVQFYEFNATAIDAQRTVSAAWVEWNGTNYTNIYNNGNMYSFNRTNLPIGTHSYKWYANDSLGNENATGAQTYVVRDTVSPVVQITDPENKTYTDTGLQINFTFAEEARDQCWYSLNNGANTTITGCLNSTAITALHGQNNITLWINDSSGNKGSAIIFFTQNNAPSITAANATTGATGVISSAANPTNNNTFVRFAAEYSDTNGDNATLYVCKQDDGSRDGCGAGGQWCIHASSSNPKTCDYSITPAETAESYAFYAFISDTYITANQSGTFAVNHPPSLASASITPSIAYETSVLNCTNGTITDEDTLTLSYKWYKNSAVINGQTQWNLTSVSFDHYDNISCEITPTDGHSYAGSARNSTSIQIRNSLPAISIGNTFTDYGTEHAFNVTATASDADGLTDITSCKVWRRTGSDAYASEAGVYSSDAGNCTAKINTSDSDDSGPFAVNDNVSIIVEFFDAQDSINTTVSVHAIPNQAPSASSGDVLPSSPNTTQTLTCSYVFSDDESDSEGSTSFRWYKNNAVQTGLLTSIVSASYTSEGETWKCEITPVDQYGGTGNALNSTAETIINSVPAISIGNTFTDYGTEHAFNVTATASDADGLTDITSCKVWRRTGSDAYASEAGVYSSDAGNCTAKINTSDSDDSGPFAVYDSISIIVEFFDEAASVNTTSSVHTIPNRVPETSAPILEPSVAYKSTANITCINGTTTDAESDSITFRYKWYNNSIEITGAETNYLTNGNYSHFNNITCQIMPDDNYINGSARNMSVVISNTPPVLDSSAIVPTTAYETTVLNCTNSSTSDVDSDAVTLLYKWYSNGAVISGQTQWNITGTYFNHFDNVSCQATPYDSYDTGTPRNATAVQILNTPPVISNVAVLPSAAYVNDTLTCSGTFTDVDIDSEAGSTFKWYRNGTVISGATDRTLAAGSVLKHENVSCEYRPKDGYDFGSSANSSEVTILNSRPIVSVVNITPEMAYETSVLNCTNGTIIDRDGDPITLSYKWYTNRTELDGQAQWNLTGTYFNHFDNVTCQITAYDNDENGTAVNDTLMILNSLPVIYTISVSPEEDGWGETFTFSANVSDVDNDSINVSLWLSKNNATWAYDSRENCTSCLLETIVLINKSNFACADIGENFFRINATDEYGATNISWSGNLSLLKSALSQSDMIITQGNGQRIGTRGSESIAVTVSIYDANRNIFVSAGVKGKIWVTRNGTLWNSGDACTTNSNGNCTINFDPDCTYTGDEKEFRGGVYNDTCYMDVNSTTGTLTVDAGVECMHEITFVLELNISGTENDAIKTVAGAGSGFYRPEEISKYYICIEDMNVENDPVFGIVFSGDDFSSINVSSSSMRMSQYQAGNMFVLPVTRGGCKAIDGKMGLIENNKLLTQPFAWFADNDYPLEISLDYPVNIQGDESMKGSFTLTLEKNGSAIIAKTR